MQPRTAFRLAMLANGYWPLLNDCKRSIELGWPRRVVDEAEVRSWDRSALTSTGLKIDGDLAVIDADVSEADFVAADYPHVQFSRKLFRCQLAEQDREPVDQKAEKTDVIGSMSILRC